MARNLKIVLSYDGSEFSGWQVQPGVPTVQGKLAEAIRRVTGEGVLPQGAGRTDAGVHALAQVASCALQSPIPVANLLGALNDVLPPSVRVIGVEEAPPDFHARHAARSKTYRYRVFRGTICPPFLARYVCHYSYPLDFEAIESAAESIVGEHDFTSFAAVNPARGSGRDQACNLRRIARSVWEQAGEELTYTVTGSGFLQHMVRNLVGTFLLTGRGTLSVQDFKQVLAARKRSAAGPTAPASGLYLVNVEY